MTFVKIGVSTNRMMEYTPMAYGAAGGLSSPAKPVVGTDHALGALRRRAQRRSGSRGDGAEPLLDEGPARLDGIEVVTPPAYPAHVEVRRVSTAGTFRLRSRQPFLSQVLKGEDVGLEEVGDGIWNIVYYRTLLGKIDERTLLITGV